MTLRIPKNDTDAILRALITEVNRNRDVDVSTNQHASITRGADNVTPLAITAPDASTQPTLRVLTNQIRAVLNQHFADMSAHKSVQTAAVALAEVGDLPTADDAAELVLIIALLNQCKLRYNTGGHINTANVHFTADAANAIAAADATNLASGYTLANEMKADVTAHILLGLTGDHIELTDA